MGISQSNENGDVSNAQTQTNNVVERAGVKANEREIEDLSILVAASSLHFDPQYLRQNDATIMQATAAAVERFVRQIKETLHWRWDAQCQGQDKCFLMGILVRIVIEALPELTTCARDHLEAMLSIVSEAEVELLNISAGGQGRASLARGASNRSRAKLMLQERSERVVAAVKKSLEELCLRFDARSGSNVDAIIRNAMEPLATAATATASSLGSTNTIGDAHSVCFSTTRAAFLEHVTALILQYTDTATLVEDGAYLRLVPAVLGEIESGGAEGGALSTRIALHANRMVALSYQKQQVASSECNEQQPEDFPRAATTSASSAVTASNGGGNGNQYQAPLVIATPPEIQEILNAREAQLGQVISEIHNFTCMPALHSTITNPAGSHIIEFDTIQEQPSSFKMHNHERSDLGITKAGRYVRISPAVVLLMVLTKTTNTVVEHHTETINLVREDFAPNVGHPISSSSSRREEETNPPPSVEGAEVAAKTASLVSIEESTAAAVEHYKKQYGYGWRDLSSGILYDTVIPNNDPTPSHHVAGSTVAI